MTNPEEGGLPADDRSDRHGGEVHRKGFVICRPYAQRILKWIKLQQQQLLP